MRLRHLAIAPGVTWESIRRDLDAWAKDVRAVLNGGWRMRDQLRVVRDVVIDTAALPVIVETAPGISPLGIQLVRAVKQLSADGQIVSGGAVTWDVVEGGVRIHSIDGLAASTRYDAVIAVWE